MASLKEHDVDELVPINRVPKEQNITVSRLILEQKAAGRFKAWVVIRGYSQEAGVDYGKTFAPVCRIGSQIILLAISCEHDWLVYQMDFQFVFLPSPVEGGVYVKMSPGQEETYSETGAPMVMNLKRSLYGPAQSPALWYRTIHTALLGTSFCHQRHRTRAYTRTGSDDSLAILTLYVDDTLLSGASQKVAQRLKKALVVYRFAMVGFGEIGPILGMSVCRDYGKILPTISQEDYLQSILKRFGMLECNTINTPRYWRELSNEQPEETILGARDIKFCQKIEGSLLYLGG